jgi:hypothetical protein
MCGSSWSGSDENPPRRLPYMSLFAEDVSNIKPSWRLLLDQGARRIYPAHGDPFPAEVLARRLQ